MLPRIPGTKVVAFLATSRPEAALTFYRDTLGLALEEDTPFAIVFDSFGTMLRVQKVPSVKPAPYTSFGFDVPDIEAAVSSLLRAGVRPVRYPQLDQDELGIWISPSGARVCWFHDPDGNVISLSEF